LRFNALISLIFLFALNTSTLAHAKLFPLLISPRWSKNHSLEEWAKLVQKAHETLSQFRNEINEPELRPDFPAPFLVMAQTAKAQNAIKAAFQETELDAYTIDQIHTSRLDRKIRTLQDLIYQNKDVPMELKYTLLQRKEWASQLYQVARWYTEIYEKLERAEYLEEITSFYIVSTK